MSKRIAIVGGGYAGAELAKALQDKADVTLIEQQSHFVHTPAMIRALVTPELLDQALIPYDKLLTRGEVIQARVTGVDGDGVTLEDGRRVDADYVVVATGSDNATPFRPNGNGIGALRAENARVHGLLKQAQTVAIVGAGAVGSELAGEIAHFMPEKDVTLISATPTLFPDMPKALGKGLLAKLQAANVTMKLGARVENLEHLSAPYAGTLQLDTGEAVTADLIIPVIGSRAVSGLLQDLQGVEMSGGQRIKTDRWMRPTAMPNVFAVGDVADIGDGMTIVAISRQLPWLKKMLIAVVDGAKVEDVKPYKPWSKAPILLPLGPQKGQSFLSLFTAGDFLTRVIKGKDLFLTKTHKLLNTKS